jgi:hypothetical protein
LLSTAVTVRVTVCLPASAPIAMFGWLRSLGSMLPTAEQVAPVAASWPVPHSQRSQSVELLS